MKTLKFFGLMAFFAMASLSLSAQTQVTDISGFDDLGISYTATGNSITLPNGIVAYEVAYSSSKKSKNTGTPLKPKWKCRGSDGSCSKGKAYVDTNGNIHVLTVDEEMGQGGSDDATLYYQLVDGEVEETYE